MQSNMTKRIILALIGILLIAIGVAFNAAAGFGNDPIGIVYDGVRNATGLSQEQLGFVSNFVNIALIVVLLFVGRKYIHIGTLIYILPYGAFVTLGTNLYFAIFGQGIFINRLIAVVIGCIFIYIGVGLYITVNIGLDPFTGVVMVLSDWSRWEFRRTKICFDIGLVILGTLLGGTLGVITFITAFTAGPSIQYFSKVFTRALSGWLEGE
ncbi:putative membrane protein [Lachnospiraceae bacterium KM106-2]|nr:putative membrane protein [Lachnospiraceae bacterium KM106-2]